MIKIKPMTCKTAELPLDSYKDEEFYAELKYDVIRAIYDNGILYNREGRDISHRFPEVLDAFMGCEAIVDGEIVAVTGKFEDIQQRLTDNKLDIEIRSKKYPAKFVIIYCFKNYHTIPLSIEKVKAFPTIQEGWNYVIKNDCEGLILKKSNWTINGYQQGVRSDSWLKKKYIKEVELEFDSYEKNPKGLTLIDKNGVRVACLGEQSTEVKRRLDTEGKITATIRYLEKTANNKYRQPSFKELSG